MVASKICTSVDSRIRPQVTVLAEQVIFMAKKLKEQKAELRDQPLTIEYDNGGGQTGIRENPAFTAYEKLLTTYTRSLTALRDVIGDDAPKEMSELDNLRKKFQVVK